MKFSRVTTITTLSIGLSTCTNAFSFTTPSKTSSRRNTQLNMSAKEDKKRVVVTGLGIVSGCGLGHEDFFQSCIDGKSSLGTVTRFDATHYPCSIASEVPDDLFDPSEWFHNVKNIRTNDRFTHFAVAAARMCLKDGGVGDTPDTLENADKVGVMVGTAFGGMETFEKETLKLDKKPERPKVSLRKKTFYLLTYVVHSMRIV